LNVAVLYHSIYGSTRQYAEWIAEETGAVCVDLTSHSIIDPDQVDTLVFGSFVHAGSLSMRVCKYITDNIDIIRSKRCVLFSVSASDPWSKQTREAFEHSLPAEYRSNIAFFPLPGKVDSKNFKLMHKLVFGMAKFEDMDKIDRGALAPVMKFIRSGKR
jgi:menaquinone-dependent protoporphyrinogen IX oxidase